MTIFTPGEKVEVVASQNFRYDNYSGYQYYLERVDVDGKCGLVCVENLEDCGSHSKVILDPVYHEIKLNKMSTPKAHYDRYTVFADGQRMGTFTMVLNEWIPLCNN